MMFDFHKLGIGMLKSIVSLSAASVIAMSAVAQDQEANPVEPEATPSRSIAVLMAPEPTEYKMENKSHVGGLVHFFRNNSLGSNLSLDMMRQKPRLAELLNHEVAKQLSGKGISISAAPSVSINAEKPWKLDYSTLSKHDKPVLFIYYESIGVKSQRSEGTYKPFTYVVYCLVTPKRSKDCTESGRASFGDGHDEDSDEGWTIANLREEQWRSADEVYANLPEITQAYRRAVPRMVGWLTESAVAYLGSEEYRKLAAK